MGWVEIKGVGGGFEMVGSGDGSREEVEDSVKERVRKGGRNEREMMCAVD